jgi:nucleotide-binding universal stress UspA family protein
MYTKIVVGTDGSERAQKAVERAAELARGLDAELLLVEAIAPIVQTVAILGGEAAHIPQSSIDAVTVELEAMAERLSADGVRTTARLVQRTPPDALIDVAESEGADLIVVGSRGMSGAGRLLGSVPNTVSHRAHCDVLIVATG